MGKFNFTDEFKREDVAQIVERDYSTAEVSQRLGVSTHSLYACKKRFSGLKGLADDNRDAEIRQLKRKLARVTKERDILKKPPRISRGMPSDLRVYCRASFAILCLSNALLSACPSERLL